MKIIEIMTLLKDKGLTFEEACNTDVRVTKDGAILEMELGYVKGSQNYLHLSEVPSDQPKVTVDE